jgi:hypothetical protein
MSLALRRSDDFNRLVFYRLTETELIAERLMHGARDLPRRLVEPPGASEV